MQLKRVVITGTGAISPLGVGCEALYAALAAGRSATVPAPEAWSHAQNLASRVVAPAPLLNEKDLPRQQRRSMSRMSIFAVQAAQQALVDAFGDVSLALSHFDAGRLGCVVGSTTGSIIAFNDIFEILIPGYDLGRLPAMKFFQILSHTAAMNVAQYFKLTGTVLAPGAACAAGLQAVGGAFDLIRLGTQDAVLCGGAEELHLLVTGSFDGMFAASSKYNDCPSRTPRPFDRDRDGLVCGEGSGILLLEEYEHARARGAKIYGEVLGYHTCSSGTHVSHSDKASLLNCIGAALKNSGVSPGDVGYISAHATGTLQGDAEEVAAIRELFGDRTPVSSLKGHLGHTLASSGSLELIASLQMMREGVLFPTRNLENVAPDCEGVHHLHEPLRREFDLFVKNSFALGGISCSLVCAKEGRRPA